MTDSRQTPDSAEDELLQHFRQQATGEPPARLDSMILAAARREAPAPSPSLWQRWWQACQRPRWQVAFASLVGVAFSLAAFPLLATAALLALVVAGLWLNGAEPDGASGGTLTAGGHVVPPYPLLALALLIGVGILLAGATLRSAMAG